MELKIATIADYALVDQLGKMSIIGIYDMVGSLAFPLTPPRLFVALRLQCERIEIGTTHTLRIQLMDANGTVVSKDFLHQFVVAMEQPAPEGARPNVQVIVDFSGARIPSAGQYSFEISVDNLHIGSLPLTAVQVTPSLRM